MTELALAKAPVGTHPQTRLEIDDALLDACITSTIEGLEMSEVQPIPVGASRFITGSEEISVLVSLYGEYNGSVYLNMSRYGAVFLAGRMLGEDLQEIDDDLLDCISEIGNIVAGRFKENLLKSKFHISGISLPALVFGANYNLYHARGLVTAAVTFELPEIPMHRMKDRFISTSVALMRR